jgi:VIT1/CCC1 family predicted Fe2+/Mn2+ transporter
MPNTPHIEKHFNATETVRDVVIGMSDGLTVPFALAAGLSGAVAATGLIVTAGLAETAAGAIAMGLGGFLAARTDEHHYNSELVREHEEVRTKPEAEAAEVREVLSGFGLTPAEAEPIVEALRRDPKRWVEFMMRFELGLERPDPRRALKSALTIAAAYIAGGLVPLIPYMLMTDMNRAVLSSVVCTLAALLIFGGVKARLTGISPVKGAVQTALIGGIAATAAFAIARAVGHG